MIALVCVEYGIDSSAGSRPVVARPEPLAVERRLPQPVRAATQEPVELRALGFRQLVHEFGQVPVEDTLEQAFVAALALVAEHRAVAQLADRDPGRARGALEVRAVAGRPGVLDGRADVEPLVVGEAPLGVDAPVALAVDAVLDEAVGADEVLLQPGERGRGVPAELARASGCLAFQSQRQDHERSVGRRVLVLELLLPPREAGAAVVVPALGDDVVPDGQGVVQVGGAPRRVVQPHDGECEPQHVVEVVVEQLAVVALDDVAVGLFGLIPPRGVAGALVGVEPGVQHVREPPVVERLGDAGARRVAVLQVLRPRGAEVVVEAALGDVGPGRPVDARRRGLGEGAAVHRSPIEKGREGKKGGEFRRRGAGMPVTAPPRVSRAARPGSGRPASAPGPVPASRSARRPGTAPARG